MTKSSFWRDASQGGAGLGLAGMIFSLAAMLWSAGGFIFNLVNSSNDSILRVVAVLVMCGLGNFSKKKRSACTNRPL